MRLIISTSDAGNLNAQQSGHGTNFVSSTDDVGAPGLCCVLGVA